MLYRGRGVNEDQVISRLSTALETARNAVAADNRGEYAAAFSQYKSAIDIFESEISNIPEEHQPELLRKTQGYQNRVNLIAEHVPSIKGASTPATTVPSPTVATSPTGGTPSAGDGGGDAAAVASSSSPSSGSISSPDASNNVESSQSASGATTTTTTTTTKGAYISSVVSKTAPSSGTSSPSSTSPKSGVQGSSGTMFFKNLFSKDKGDAVLFKEEEIPTTCDASNLLPIPAEAIKRPFWLVKALMRTMVSGAFLAPNVYVSTDVWFQSGVKFVAVKEKVNAFELILGGLQTMQAISLGDTSAAAAALQEFAANCDEIQATLSKSLKFIGSDSIATGHTGLAKLSKGLSKRLSGASKTDEGYVELVLEVFQLIVELDPWVDAFSTDPAMAKFSVFLQSVVLAVVVRDFGMLLQRYIVKVKENWLE